jgi:hypothetical protein
LHAEERGGVISLINIVPAIVKPAIPTIEVSADSFFTWLDFCGYPKPDFWAPLKKPEQKTIAEAALRDWYKNTYVPERVRAVERPSYQDDLKAAEAFFPDRNIPRSMLRDKIRKELAPKDWSSLNKPKTKKSTPRP